MMTNTTPLERCIIHAIRSMRERANIGAQHIIELIEGAHLAGYINRAKRSRLIDATLEVQKK